MIRLRVDDFPHTSRREPQHTLDSFRDFHQRLTQYLDGRRYLLGVVPGQCTPEDVLFLRNETDVVVGMHGTDHDEQKLDRNGGNQFEPYLTRTAIADILKMNRQHLDDAIGRPVTIYMPPRNVFGLRELGAFEQVKKFTHFTTGPETSAEIQIHHKAIHSQKPHQYGRTDELLNLGSHFVLIEQAQTQDVVLTLHWTWEVNIGLSHMERFFSLIDKELFADFDE